jgi:hypothetical protein
MLIEEKIDQAIAELESASHIEESDVPLAALLRVKRKWSTMPPEAQEELTKAINDDLDAILEQIQELKGNHADHR